MSAVECRVLLNTGWCALPGALSGLWHSFLSQFFEGGDGRFTVIDEKGIIYIKRDGVL